MKKFNSILVAVAMTSATLFFGACSDEPTNNNNNNSSDVIISANITSNTTWTKDKNYVLAGRIAVTSGATLTIEPGTVIKAQAGTGANATALIIARGAKLMAEGTASAPIIFTSVADEIKSGEISSPNLDAGFDGLWGGLIILGKAPASLKGDITETVIEGIPPTDPNGFYGGNVSDDNSGVIKYVSVRHGGANIGEGNEINGITLGGVGSGTVIENVEVIGNQDDGIEFFGGTVSVKNAVVWNAGDDAIDTDQAWAGTLDNFVVVCGPNTDHALEIDGPEGSMIAAHTVKNGWVKGSSVAELADFRSNAQGTFENIYFFGFPDPATDGRGDFSLDAATAPNFTAGTLKFSNLEVTTTLTDLTKIFKSGTDAHAKAVNAGSNTVGATLSAFTGWSWTEKAGNLVP